MNLPLIRNLYNKAEKEALAQLKHEAKVHLSKQPHLKQFVMAMGTYFFVDINDEVDYNEKHQSKKVNKIVYEFNPIFKLTGNPVMITKLKGKFNFSEVNDW